MQSSTYGRVFVVAVGLAALTAWAGPLDPPAGPVGPSYKTMTEVEPRIAISMSNTPGDADSVFKIAQAGSYYLTGNVVGVAAKHGIKIAASNVTLDLNGFVLDSQSLSTLSGVTTSAVNLENITVRNGIVRGWGQAGVDIARNGRNLRVQGVTSSSNSGHGFRFGDLSVVDSCEATSNGLDGFRAGSQCVVTNCTSGSNAAGGFTFTAGSRIVDCVAVGNSTDGISLGASGNATGCSATSNFAAGIRAVDNAVIAACTVRGCKTSGIIVGTGCIVSACDSSLNTVDGILGTNNCLIRDNVCDGNGAQGSGNGAGIHVTGVQNRVEGNHCTQANRGIEVGGASNFIIRNTCANNGVAWVIAANNTYGQIVNCGGVATPAVNGSAAAGATGTTDADANFTY